MCEICSYEELQGRRLDKVADEMDRQEGKWGVQNHPLLGESSPRFIYESLERLHKTANDSAVENGTLGWDGILLEEVYEALAANEVDDQVEELIQVAAVAMSAVDSLRRNGR